MALQNAQVHTVKYAQIYSKANLQDGRETCPKLELLTPAGKHPCMSTHACMLAYYCIYHRAYVLTLIGYC